MGMPINQVSPIRPNFYAQGNSFRRQQNNNYKEKNYSSNISKNNSHTNFKTSNPSNKYDSNNYNVKHSKIGDCNSQNFQDFSPLFNLLGLNIYFDDILIICILFFLYNEGVNDPYLFFNLILLLMS